MRNTFSRCLVEAAREDDRVLLLTGDHGYALFDEFRQACPDQYLNAGVAEQNMVGVAAGLAKAGFRPVVYGLSAFVPLRVLEQIKMDVCYEQLPVVFIGDGAGIVYSALGTSHQCTEDIAALRAVPHLNLLSPADDLEMSACMRLALESAGPVYLRMGKADLGRVHKHPPAVRWGELCPLRAGAGRLVWIATGSMVTTALAVAERWAGSAVWSAPSLKPLRPEAVTAAYRGHEVVVVLEEHSVHGGLGSAVTEIVCGQSPAWVCRIGIADRFSQFCGSYEYLLREHRLDRQSIIHQVEDFLQRVASRGRLNSAA
jgi:transketolase